MQKTGDVIVMTSERVLEATTLIGPSINMEMRARVSVETVDALIQDEGENNESGVVRGQKTPVDDLVIFDAANGGKAATITLPTGQRRTIALGHAVSEITAGSAANIGNGLVDFGSHAGIIGAVGQGAGRDALVRSLAERGLTDVLLLRRKGGSSRSLILYEPDGTATILSRKPRYECSPELLGMLAERTQPAVLVCSGFVEYELPLIQALWRSRVREAKILSPHVGCFEHESGRRICLELAASADLFHVNLFEAGRLLGYEDNAALSCPDETSMREICKRIGSQIVCITAGKEGSYAYTRDRSELIRQPAFPISTINNVIGAGDVHLTSLIWYLWLRRRRLDIKAALEVAARVCASKIAFTNSDIPRPWEGIPSSEIRKPWVREAEARLK